jgi:ribokinase
MTDLLVVGGVFLEVLDADRESHLRYGGSGLTAAVAAASLGAEVALAGSVGEEDEDAVRALLAVAGVDDSPLIATEGRSGTFLFAHEQDASHPWPLYKPADARPARTPDLPEARTVLAFGIPDYDPLALGWLKDHTPETLVWDRQGWLSRPRNDSLAASTPARMRVCVANRREAEAEFGRPEGTQPPLGFTVALIKDGRAGVRVIQQVGEERCEVDVPAFVVDTAETIGSGDVFGGAFAAAYAGGADLLNAVQVGCAGAAVSLARRMNLLGAEDRPQIEELLATRGVSL